MAMASYTRFVRSHLESPGVQRYWRESQTFFSDNLRQYMETIMEDDGNTQDDGEKPDIEQDTGGEAKNG